MNPDSGENEIGIESNIVFEGDNSLRFYAKASDNTLSKSDIEKEGFNAPECSTVRIEANFFIASSENIENLLLIDLECCSCWDPAVPNNQEVISESGMNMPNAILFEAEFANNGIDFELQQPLFYERFQIGATANPTQFDIEIFVDDVKLDISE